MQKEDDGESLTPHVRFEAVERESPPNTPIIEEHEYMIEDELDNSETVEDSPVPSPSEHTNTLPLNKLSVRKTNLDSQVKTNKVFVSEKLYHRFKKQAYLELFGKDVGNKKDILYLLISNKDKCGVFQCMSDKSVDNRQSSRKSNFFKNNTSTIALNFFQRDTLHVKEFDNVTIDSIFVENYDEECPDDSPFYFPNGRKVSSLESLTLKVRAESDIISLLKMRNNNENLSEDALRDQFVNFTKTNLVGHVFSKGQTVGLEYFASHSKKNKKMIEFVTIDLCFFSNDIAFFGKITDNTTIDIVFHTAFRSNYFMKREHIAEEQPVVPLVCNSLRNNRDTKYNTVFCSSSMIETESFVTNDGKTCLLYARIIPSPILYRVKLCDIDCNSFLLGKAQRQNSLVAVGDQRQVQFFFLDPSLCQEKTNDEIVQEVKEGHNPYYCPSDFPVLYDESHFRALQSITFKVVDLRGATSISFSDLLGYMYSFYLYHYFQIGQELAFYLGYFSFKMTVIAINTNGLSTSARGVPFGGFFGKQTLCYFEKSRAFEYKHIPSNDLLELQESVHYFNGSLTGEREDSFFFVNSLCPEKRQPQCYQIENFSTFSKTGISIVHADMFSSRDLFQRISALNKSLQFQKIIRATIDSNVRHVVFNLDTSTILMFGPNGHLLESISESLVDATFDIINSDFYNVEEWKLLIDQGCFKQTSMADLNLKCSTILFKSNFLILFGGHQHETQTNLCKPSSAIIIFSIKDKKLVTIVKKKPTEENPIHMPLEIYSHSANLYNSNCMIVYGGVSYDSQQKKTTSHNKVLLLDMRDFEWSILETRNEGPSVFNHTSLQSQDSLFICAGNHSSTTVTEYPYLWELNLYTLFWRCVRASNPKDTSIGSYCLSLLHFCPTTSQLVFLEMLRESKDDHYDSNYYKLSKLQKNSRHLRVRRQTIALEKSPLKAFKLTGVLRSISNPEESSTFQDVLIRFD